MDAYLRSKGANIAPTLGLYHTVRIVKALLKAIAPCDTIDRASVGDVVEAGKRHGGIGRDSCPQALHGQFIEGDVHQCS